MISFELAEPIVRDDVRVSVDGGSGEKFVGHEKIPLQCGRHHLILEVDYPEHVAGRLCVL